MAECNCWQCQAERLYGAKRTTPMRGLQIGKVYLYQLFNETVMEFETLSDANNFRAYADAQIPYWDYDPVKTIDLNDPKQVITWAVKGWVKDNNLGITFCHECQSHTEDPETGKLYCRKPLGCMGCIEVKPNDFCSRGEKKSGDA